MRRNLWAAKAQLCRARRAGCVGNEWPSLPAPPPVVTGSRRTGFLGSTSSAEKPAHRSSHKNQLQTLGEDKEEFAEVPGRGWSVPRGPGRATGVPRANPARLPAGGTSGGHLAAGPLERKGTPQRRAETGTRIQCEPRGLPGTLAGLQSSCEWSRRDAGGVGIWVLIEGGT